MTAALAERPQAGPWDVLAACRGKSALMDVGRDASRRQLEAPLALCRRCPILFGCRDWVLGRPLGEEISGVCGGLTEQQRRRHRDQRFTRTCTICGQTKKLADLNGDNRNLDGHGARCMACVDAACPAELICRACGQTKPAGQFRRDHHRATGRAGNCSDCHATGMRAYRAANKTTPRKEATMTSSALNGSALADLTGSPAEPATDDEPEQAVSGDLPDTIDGVIERARRLDDEPVRKQLDRTLEAIERLRELVTVAAEVAELEAKLAAAKARAKELSGTTRRSPATRPAARANGAPPKQIRAWAAEMGRECPQYGRVPQDIVQEYEAAHGEATP